MRTQEKLKRTDRSSRRARPEILPRYRLHLPMDRTLLRQWREILVAAGEIMRARPDQESIAIAKAVTLSKAQPHTLQECFERLSTYISNEIQSKPVPWVDPTVFALWVPLSHFNQSLLEYFVDTGKAS